MRGIFKFTLTLGIVFVLSVSFTLVKSLETDLFASGAKENDSPVQKIKRHEIEQFDIANDFLFAQDGKASWYGRRFHNRKTASGEKYDMNGLSAAHRSLPFGTIIRVTNQENNKSILVRVNDRGPFIRSKILDLSKYSSDIIEGQNNPEVKVETLIPNDFLFLGKKDEDYYFGFSYELPLVCLPTSVLKFLDSSNDFEEAIEIYKNYTQKFPGKFLYLMTMANFQKYNINGENDIIYYIGMYDGTSYQFAEEK